MKSERDSKEQFRPNVRLRLSRTGCAQECGFVTAWNSGQSLELSESTDTPSSSEYGPAEQLLLGGGSPMLDRVGNFNPTRAKMLATFANGSAICKYAVAQLS